jgi:hypothetical protein
MEGKVQEVGSFPEFRPFVVTWVANTLRIIRKLREKSP